MSAPLALTLTLTLNVQTAFIKHANDFCVHKFRIKHDTNVYNLVYIVVKTPTHVHKPQGQKADLEQILHG